MIDWVNPKRDRRRSSDSINGHSSHQTDWPNIKSSACITKTFD